jgi:hypothetical protein
LVKRINSRNFTEIVLFQGGSAKRSHQRLFSLKDDCYFTARHGITESILLSAGKSVEKLHIVTGWRDMLKVALWTSGKPSSSDTLALIGKICQLPEGLDALKTEDVNDIFRRLYQSGRLDVFRNVCQTAKITAESKIRREKLLVHCHLVSDGETGIVASSL